MTGFMIAFRNLVQGRLDAEVGQRVHPMVLPPGAQYPAATYQQISGDTERHLQGASALRRARIQADVWAKEYDDVSRISGILRRELNAFRGPAGDYYITDCWVSLERDAYEDGTKTYRNQTDFEVMYREKQT